MFNKITSYFILASGAQARYGRIWQSPINEAESSLPGRKVFTLWRRNARSAYKEAGNSNTNVLRKKMLPDFFSLAALTALIFFLLTTPALSCTNPVGVAGDVMYNDSEHVMQWCDGTDWVGVGDPPYIPNGVSFDGATDYVETDTSTLTGVSDGPRGTLSVWFKADEISVDRPILNSLSGRINVFYDQSQGQLRLAAENTSNAIVLDLRTTSLGLSTGQWHHLLASWDLAPGTPVTHMYIDGVSDNNEVTATSGENIHHTQQDYTVGGNFDATQFWDGDIADVWYDTDTYLDLSDASIRAKFIDAGGFPVDLGSDGARPIGTSPDIFLSGDTATWHTNDGTGGGFTENGALTDALSDPGENLGPTAGLVSWWKMDETSGATAFDTMGNYDLGLTGGGPCDIATDNRDGVIGRAQYLAFDQCELRYNAAAGELGPDAEFTVGGWFRMKNLDDSTASVFGRGIGGSANNYGIGIISGNYFFSLWNTTPAFESSGASSTPATVGEWIHLIGVRDATHLRLYVNGIEESSDPFAGSTSTSTGNFNIGSGFTPETGFDADDIRYYDRALSPDEIADLYNTGRACQNPDGFRGGDTMYNTSDHVPQYCNLREWMPMDVQGGDGGSCPNIGDVCTDGSVFAGVSPDGNHNMYTTPNDQGTDRWNDGAFGGDRTDTDTDCTDSPPGTLSTCQTGEDNTYILTVTDSDGDDAGVQPHRTAQTCYDLVAHGSDDWYLPAQDELNVLYTNRVAIGNFDLSGAFPQGRYWSSSEFDSDLTRYINFNGGFVGSQNKNIQSSYRCVRKGQPRPECTNPTGAEGDIVYNSTHSVLQYCEGDEWIAIGDYN